MIYFDHAATSPMDPALMLRSSRYFKEHFGNPSTLYKLGEETSGAIQSARESIAKKINAQPNEIYFTSGGTESDNWALRGILKEGDHVITTEFEHHAILETCKYLEKHGVEVSYIKPNKNGFVSVADIADKVQQNTKLVSVMMVNNEIGTIQPIKEIAEWASHNNLIIHTDAVQAVGHMDIDVEDLGVDLLSASGHKFGGPQGIGFLYIKSNIEIEPLIYGGGQEKGMRSGTENVAGILLMNEALGLSLHGTWNKTVWELRNYMLEELLKIPNVYVNGSIRNRIGTNVNIYIKGVNAEELIMMLNEDDIYLSAGSACTSSDNKPSHVLKAIGCSDDRARQSVRITLGKDNSLNDVEKFLKKIKYYINQLR